MDLANFALVTSIIAGMVAIPVGSQEVTGEFTGNFDSAGADMLEGPEEETEELPREISEQTEPDKFEKTFQTAFGKAIFEIESQEAFKKLIQPDKSIEVTRKNDLTVWSFESNECSLEVEKGSGEKKTVCETPDGTLETIEESGKTQKFEGMNREEVQEICKGCREDMHSSMDKLRSIEDDLDLIRKKVVIKGYHNEDGSEEDYITLKNLGEFPVDLEGWTIEGDDSNDDPCPLSRRIEPHETIEIYIDAPECGIENLGHGEELVLKNSQGEEVNRYE